MTERPARPVTRARVLRRIALYRRFLKLPEMVVNTGILNRAWGCIFASSDGRVTVLIDDQQPLTDEDLDAVVLHELAHAECYRLRQTLRHDAGWRATCARLSEQTGVRVK